MPTQPISAPDPVPPAGSASNIIRAHPEDASFETDLTDLAARFSAQSGGGLSPELSADLALEIVLNEIVEQACVTTGATGAAIVSQRDGEMVCRATSGPTAPVLGARLDSSSGLSGECIRTKQTQRSDDVLADARADLEASARLGVRSVMVMPLLRGAELAGVFELFSSVPNAFGKREEDTLTALAERALRNLARAAEPLHPVPETPTEVASESARAPMEEAGLPPEAPPVQRSSEFLTWVLGVAVVVCAMLLGFSLAPHFGLRRQIARSGASAPKIESARPVEADAESQPVVPGKVGTDTAQQPNSSISTAKRHPSVAPGGLLISQNGKEIFRVDPPQPGEAKEKGSGVQPAAARESEQTISLSPSEAEGSLVRRVEPKYPEDARQQRIQGAVLLNVQIGTRGEVQDIQVISGNPLLARASIDAVKRWRFKPRRISGRPAEMQTQVTLNFLLPREN